MWIGLSAAMVAGAGKFMWTWSPARRRGIVYVPNLREKSMSEIRCSAFIAMSRVRSANMAPTGPVSALAAAHG